MGWFGGFPGSANPGTQPLAAGIIHASMPSASRSSLNSTAEFKVLKLYTRFSQDTGKDTQTRNIAQI
jgi:hypothetical protein